MRIMSAKSDFCSSPATKLEEKLEVILGHWKCDNGCVKILLEHLSLSLTNAKHIDGNCTEHCKNLESLSIILKIYCNRSRDEMLRGTTLCVDNFIDKCLETLYIVEDGKDICVPIFCDILCYSLHLLPSKLLKSKMIFLMFKNKSTLIELTEQLSAVCIDSSYMSLEVTKLGINLRIWEVLTNVLLLYNNTSNIPDSDSFLCACDIFEEKYLEIFDTFMELLLKVISFQHNVLTSQILLKVVPKLVHLTRSNSVIKKIWENIVIEFQSGDYIYQVTPHMYLIMCMLSDWFIPFGNNPVHSYPVVDIDAFWRILQYGIVSSDALIRKQALYLLKKSVERESCVHLNPFCSEKIFWWNNLKKEEFKKVWNNFFLMLEVLEEKQMHLIEPVLPVLGSLIDACRKHFIHSSWIFCVVQRAFGHECNSVVKWGVMCLSDMQLHIFMSDCVDYKLLFLTLMRALNSASLYVTDTSESVPRIVQTLRSFFTGIVEIQEGDLSSIFSGVLNSIVRVSWGPVALFYIIYALAAVPKCPVWNIDHIKVLKMFLIDALATQVVHIRGAIQTYFLESLMNLVDVKLLDMRTLADILGTFKRKECLQRGSHMWHEVVVWLKLFVKQEDALIFAKDALSRAINGDLDCEKQSAARMIVLLSDAELIYFGIHNSSCKFSVSSSLHSFLQYFENCDKRMYVCPRKQVFCLEMLIFLLEESLPIDDGDSTGQRVIVLITLVVPGIFYSLKRNLFVANNLEHFDTVNLYLYALNVLSQEPKLLPSLVKNINIIQGTVFSVLKNDAATPMSKFFAIKVLLWMSDLIHSNLKQKILLENSKILIEQQMSFLDNMFQCKTLNVVLTKTSNEKFLTRDLQTLWGKLVSEFLQTTWLVVNTYIELQSILCASGINQEFANRIWTDTFEALEIGGRGMLIPVMSVFEQIFCRFTKPSFGGDVKRFLNICWNCIFELRKSDLFLPALERFVKMTFQESLLKESHLQKILLTYAQELLLHGDTVSGVCNILLLRLLEISKLHDPTMFEPFVDIIVDALLFGPTQRRDRKIDDETCAFIRSVGDKCCINKVTSLYSDTDVRVRAIQLLLCFLHCDKPKYMKVIEKVVNRLVDKDAEVSQHKKCYFADSQHHRFRNRVMQVLLLLGTSLPEEESNKLMLYIQHSILHENHQPSVRHFQEWLLVRLLLKNSSARFKIWSMLQMASETRPGSVCSFISIIYHVAFSLPRDNGLENYLDSAMKEILPYTMAQHFNVRLYAQLTFSKLWQYAQKIYLKDASEKYYIAYLSVVKSMQTPSVLKNVKKLENFYFTTFHALEHFSLQTIFYDLPRLTNVSQEEWIPHNVFLLCENAHTGIPLLNTNSKLENEVNSSVSKTDLLEINSNGMSNSDVVNIQKKIIPWRDMCPDPDLLLSEAVLLRKQNISEDGLIVVASLIDRTPNLGGLSRTCEAFGVSQYVLGNIKYLEDKQFQVLSVTSEQWVSISEVKPNELGDYLKLMKDEGYSVVGAEQTANSIPLNDVKFPKRTILLLGNEKGGIPVNLLPLLDICVEVPQQGVVRSLNVHVTGAIFIWEYARQHNICKST